MVAEEEEETYIFKAEKIKREDWKLLKKMKADMNVKTNTEFINRLVKFYNRKRASGPPVW